MCGLNVNSVTMVSSLSAVMRRQAGFKCLLLLEWEIKKKHLQGFDWALASSVPFHSCVLNHSCIPSSLKAVCEACTLFPLCLKNLPALSVSTVACRPVVTGCITYSSKPSAAAALTMVTFHTRMCRKQWPGQCGTPSSWNLFLGGRKRGRLKKKRCN